MWSSSTYSDSSRDKSAEKLIDLVFRNSDGSFGIKDKPYKIRIEPDSCDCDDYNRWFKPCKHIRAVKKRLLVGKLIEIVQEIVSDEFKDLISYMNERDGTVNKMELYDNLIP